MHQINRLTSLGAGSGRLALLYRFPVSAFLFMLALPGAAQVNTEALRAGIETPGFSGSIGLTVGLKTGNTESLDAGVGGRIQHVQRAGRCDPAEGAEVEAGEIENETSQDGHADPCFAQQVVFLVGSYSISENDGARDSNESFSHARWAHGFGPRHAIEAFLQHEFNEFQRLDTRFLAGFGSRVALRREKHLQAFLGFGIMWEFERLDLPADSSQDREVRNGRSTNYLTLRYTPAGKRLRLISTLYVQPRVDRPSDIRLLEEGEIQVDLGKSLSLGLALSLAYDAEAPADVDKTDFALTNKLTIRF